MKKRIPENISEGTLANHRIEDSSLTRAYQKYLLLDGIDDGCHSGTFAGWPATMTDLYLGIWLYPQLKSGVQYLLYANPSGSSNTFSIGIQRIGVDDNQLFFAFGNSVGAEDTITYIFPDSHFDNWAYYVFEVNPDRMLIYRSPIGGGYVYSPVAEKTTIPQFSKSTYTLQLFNAVSTFRWKGRAHSLHIFNQSPATNPLKQQYMHEGVTGSESGLLTAYSMEAISAGKLEDLSPNNNDITVVGATIQTSSTIQKYKATRESPIYDISMPSRVGALSYYKWEENPPGDAGIIQESRISLNGGVDWNAYQIIGSPGDAIPEILGADLSSARLQLRNTLQSIDLSALLAISNLEVVVEDSLEPWERDTGTIAILMQLILTTGNLFYTTLDVEVNWQGARYDPLPFAPQDFNYTDNLSVDNMTIQIDNVSLIPVSAFLNEDQRGREVIITLAECDKFARVIDTFEVFRGFINSVGISAKIAEINITHELAFWRKQTLRKATYTLFPNLSTIELKEVFWGRKA